MIIKSLTRKSASFGSLLDYMKRGAASMPQKKGFVLLHNISGDYLQWIQQFEANEKLRAHHRSNSIKVYHEILSFSNKDTEYITMEALKDLAQKYIQLRNENAMYVIMPHQDTSHIHLHVAISGVETITGAASRISRDRFRDIKEELQRYQIETYPELVHSVVDHGSGKSVEKSEKEFQLVNRTKELSERERTKLMLDDIFKVATSRQDFFQKITDAGLNIYERGGTFAGVEGDRKMRFSTLGLNEETLNSLDTLQEFSVLRDTQSPEIETLGL